MAAGSDTYHEPYETLSTETRDMHRAIVSLMEELEAVDWYQQRADACTDEALAQVLLHNRDEEIEHAMMVLEWIRRRNPTFDHEMRTYLFTDGPITAIEEETNGKSESGAERGAAASAGDGSLQVRSLR